MKFCLIGKKLPHSYSKDIHEAAGLNYDLVELSESELASFVNNGVYDGFNVTIPYKTAVMPYLDIIDNAAKEVGSVNTVMRKNGKLYGYNTDIIGMKYMIDRTGVCLKDKVVLVLGSGGTSLTACALLKQEKAKSFYVISRNGEHNYQNCYEITDAEVIINCTPVGMFPNVEGCSIDLNRFSHLTAVFDCVYNPKKTELLLNAERLGIRFCGGLPMLVKQALAAENIWVKKVFNEDFTEKLVNRIDRDKTNIILSGMPSSGKSSIGKLLAEKLGRDFIDTDAVIEKNIGRSPESIIRTDGEQKFRVIETGFVKEVAKLSGKVISLGGGGVLSSENIKALKKNGRIIYIKRDVSLLTEEGRPLSEKEGIEALYEKRKAIYDSTCDYVVKNNDSIEKAVKEIETVYENTRY